MYKKNIEIKNPYFLQDACKKFNKNKFFMYIILKLYNIKILKPMAMLYIDFKACGFNFKILILRIKEKKRRKEEIKKIIELSKSKVLNSINMSSGHILAYTSMAQIRIIQTTPLPSRFSFGGEKIYPVEKKDYQNFNFKINKKHIEALKKNENKF